MSQIKRSVSLYSYQDSYYCGKLASVYCGPATPPTLGVNVFLSCSNDLVIYVMVNSSLNAYRSAPNWTTYRHIIQVYNG